MSYYVVEIVDDADRVGRCVVEGTDAVLDLMSRPSRMRIVSGHARDDWAWREVWEWTAWEREARRVSTHPAGSRSRGSLTPR